MRTAPNIRREHAPSRAFLIFSVRFTLAMLLGSVSLFGAAQLRAQNQNDDPQQNTQDVAGAARQAQARKQQRSEPNHVYTNEDLHRAKILTPEDQTRAAAKRKRPPNPSAKENTQPLDANSSPAREPLGDVARRYRAAKKASPFHLPNTQRELAAPKILAPMLRNASPIRPKNSRNPNLAPAPKNPTIPSHRLDPFARHRTQPTPQIFSSAPRALVQPNYSAAPRPVSPAPNSSRSIVVRPGDTLWTLSRQHLGRGTRWLELMVANPSIVDPTRLVPGASLVVPEKISSHHLSAAKVIVQSGDSLSKIALAAYGHASFWPCLAHANRTLTNPHRLSIGQSLALPASCTP